MKYVLMFFICGYGTSGNYTGHCSWKEAVTLQSQTECRGILHKNSYDFRMGQERYLLAGCFPKTPTVEK